MAHPSLCRTGTRSKIKHLRRTARVLHRSARQAGAPRPADHPGPGRCSGTPSPAKPPEIMASLDTTDELVFRLRTDVIRLNRENAELRRRLGVPVDGRAIPVDKSVDTVDTPVDKPAVDTAAVDKDRAAYQREWAAKKRAAEKIKASPSN